MTEEQRRFVEQWSTFVSDPCAFVGRFWPHITLAPYQQRILESVRDNTETWVHSANEMGKSFIAALTAIWWFSTRKSKVVTISTTESQLENILWGEIDSLLRSANVEGKPFDFRFHKTHLRVLLAEDADSDAEVKYYLKGQVAAKAESLQGHHLPHLPDGTPTVLMVIEEASGVMDEFFAAVETQRHHSLIIGNPLRAEGQYYKKCTSGTAPHPLRAGKLLRNVIHVSGDDSPNVILGKLASERGLPIPKKPIIPGILSYEQYLERDRSLAPFDKRPRLFGLFNDSSTIKLFPAGMLDVAQELYRKLKAYNETPGAERSGRLRLGRPFAMGVDCAMGVDETVWVVLGRYGVVHVEAMHTPNTRTIAGMTLRLIKRFHIRHDHVVFDTAVGKQIADELREREYDVQDVGFGQKALDDELYANLRCEMYGELARAMTVEFDEAGNPKGRIARMLATDPARWHRSWRCVALPEDELLRQDLFVLPKGVDGKGRLKLPPKDPSDKNRGGSEVSVKEMLGGRSPDRGDALVLAYYGWQRGMEYRQLEDLGSGPGIG